MKTLIIISIILFFAWLYRLHRQNKKYDRELQAYQAQQEQNAKSENYSERGVRYKYTANQRVDFQPNTVYITAFLSPIFRPTKSQKIKRKRMLARKNN